MPRLHPEPSAVAEVDLLLRRAADEARRQWQAALDARDFVEVDRWVDTGQAVHRALIALERA
jgi:hypothetical protein